MNDDQKKAVEDLSTQLGGIDIKSKPGIAYTAEPDDDTIIVSWSLEEGGAIILSDGVIDLGGGSWATSDPLEAWTANRNQGLKEPSRGPLPTREIIDPAKVPHQAAIEALVFERSEALSDYDESDGTYQGYTMEQLDQMKDSIDLLCELRDGAARVVRPADNAPDPS